MDGARMSKTMLAGMAVAGSAGIVWLARTLAGRGVTHPPPDEHRDEVDVAIDDSFPASDPPSYAGSRGGE